MKELMSLTPLERRLSASVLCLRGGALDGVSEADWRMKHVYLDSVQGAHWGVVFTELQVPKESLIWGFSSRLCMRSACFTW